VFHPSDVPEKARRAKQEVKEYTLGDVLGITKPVYHPSTRSDRVSVSFKQGCPWDNPDQQRESAELRKLDALARVQSQRAARDSFAQELRELRRDKAKMEARVVSEWNKSTTIDPRILKPKYIFPSNVSQHQMPIRLTFDRDRKDSLTSKKYFEATSTARAQPLPRCASAPSHYKSLVETAKEQLAQQRMARAQSKLEQEQAAMRKRALEFAKYDGAWDMYIPKAILGEPVGERLRYEQEALNALKKANENEVQDPKEILQEDEGKVLEVVDLWQREALKKSSLLILDNGSAGPACPHGVLTGGHPKVCGKCLKEGAFVNHSPKATKIAIHAVAAKTRALAAAAAGAKAKVATTAAAVAITGAELSEAAASHEDPVLRAHAEAINNASTKTKALNELQSKAVLLQPVPPRSASLTRAAIGQMISHRYSQEELEKFVNEMERQSSNSSISSATEAGLPPGAAFSDISSFMETARCRESSEATTQRQRRHSTRSSSPSSKPRKSRNGPSLSYSWKPAQSQTPSAHSLYADISTGRFDEPYDTSSDEESEKI